MKFGDQVIFVEKGVEHIAILMQLSVADATAGANGEPALTLAFFAKPYLPEYRYDVRHQSHDDRGVYWKEAQAGEYVDSGDQAGKVGHASLSEEETRNKLTEGFLSENKLVIPDGANLGDVLAYLEDVIVANGAAKLLGHDGGDPHPEGHPGSDNPEGVEYPVGTRVEAAAESKDDPPSWAQRINPVGTSLDEESK